MKEILFIRQNVQQWQSIENIAEDPSAYSPDDVAGAYLRVTTDLAFAQTHYPTSRITVYLNDLASVLHNSLYRRRHERHSRIITFWTQEVPLTMWEARHLLLASFIIMALSVLVGVISQMSDTDFCRIILGDWYMDETLENIRKGTPFAIYDSDSVGNMLFSITINNIMVAARIFAMGVLTSFFTGIMLIYNGVMLGCFETFFAQQHLLGPSLLAVMLHGTIEISSIVVAGAAGLAMGNAWLLPGSYSRIESFKRGAKRGLKIFVGTVPLFVVAGFIESVCTRHTHVPDAIRLAFILLSAAFVLFYFVIYPRMLHKRLTKVETSEYTKVNKNH